MNMHSAFFCLALLGAFLGVAKSDFTCFAEKLKSLENNIYEFFGENKATSCRDGKKGFIDSLQQAIDQCSVPVKTDSMSSLIDEMCDPNTELSKDLEESAGCLSLNSLDSMTDMMNCKSQSKLDSSLPVEEACLIMEREFFTCSANTIGGRCGTRAVNALHRIFKTSNSLTNGMCKELASNSSSSVYGYIHWIAIGVGLFSAFVIIIIKMAKKPAPIKYTHDLV